MYGINMDQLEKFQENLPDGDTYLPVTELPNKSLLLESISTVIVVSWECSSLPWK